MVWYEYVIHAVTIFVGVLLGNFLGQKLFNHNKNKKKTEKEGE